MMSQLCRLNKNDVAIIGFLNKNPNSRVIDICDGLVKSRKGTVYERVYILEKSGAIERLTFKRPYQYGIGSGSYVEQVLASLQVKTKKVESKPVDFLTMVGMG